MVVLSLSISHKIGIFLAHIKKKSYLCAAKVKIYTKTMKTIQLDGEILRNLGIIAEDKMVLTKVAKYLRRMAKQASQDSTLMSKEEFFARVEEAEQDIQEGKGIAFTNKADMNAWLNTL
jgi:hypothetical protein